MAAPVQLPQLEEKTETYLLTNKGMEKKDFAKEMHAHGAAPEGTTDKKKKEALAGSRADSHGSPAHAPSRKTVIHEEDRDSNFMGGRARRNSHKSHNQSQGESHMDGVGESEQKNELLEGQSQANSISEVLNEYIRELLVEDVQDEDEQAALQQDRERLQDIDFVADPLAYQYFAERIDEVSENMIELLFEDILTEVDKFSQYLLRGIGNDLWSFMYFMLTCLERLDMRKAVYEQIQRALETFCEKMLEKEKERFTGFFRDLFLTKFVDAVKSADCYEKREVLVSLLYCFVPNSPGARHEALRLYKAKLADMLVFIQSLAVLIGMEPEKTKENDDLIKDFKIYAKLAIKDKRPAVRLNGLLLMHRLTALDSDWVQRVMIRYFDCVSPHDCWENRAMTVAVYTSLLAKIKASELYVQNIRPKHGDMAKVMTVENEMLVRVMKEMIEQVTGVVAKVLQANLTPDLTRIAMIYVADVMEDSKGLANVFLDLLLDAGDEIRRWVLHAPSEEEENDLKEKFYLRTRTSLCYPCMLNRSALRRSANDLLAEMAEKMRGVKLPSASAGAAEGKAVFGANYLDVLLFCFENADFQRLNSEVTDAYINHSIDHVFEAMALPDLCQAGSQLLLHYTESLLKSEVVVHDLEKRMAQMLLAVFNGEQVPAEDREAVRENGYQFVEELFGRYTPEKGIYDRFAELCKKLHRYLNRKTLHDPEAAAFVEQRFGESAEEELADVEPEGGFN